MSESSVWAVEGKATCLDRDTESVKTDRGCSEEMRQEKGPKGKAERVRSSSGKVEANINHPDKKHTGT